MCAIEKINLKREKVFNCLDKIAQGGDTSVSAKYNLIKMFLPNKTFHFLYTKNSYRKTNPLFTFDNNEVRFNIRTNKNLERREGLNCLKPPIEKRHKEKKQHIIVVSVEHDRIYFVFMSYENFLKFHSNKKIKERIYVSFNEEALEQYNKFGQVLIGKFVDANVISENTNKKNSFKSTNMQSRTQVEQVAINTTIHHFKAEGFEVTSVESKNVGWDLEALTKNIKLRIEVKGTSKSTVDFTLTHNERMKKNIYKNNSYRIAVVTECLSKHPKLSIFKYSKQQGEWIDEQGRCLKSVLKHTITERMYLE